MKILYRLLIVTCLCIIGTTTSTFAQNISKTSAQLLDEGIALNDAGKYDEAIEKYKAALQIDPDYQTANYEIGYSLYVQNKYDEAIVYLKKVINAGKASRPASYNILGGIYDDRKDFSAAIAAFKKGISIDPKYQKLHYNLAYCYYEQEDKYKEAEEEILIALKLDPAHTRSHRLYGEIAYHQDRTLPAILGYCSFLLINRDTSKAAPILKKLIELLSDGKQDLNTFIKFKESLKSNLEIATSPKVVTGYDATYQHFFADYLRQLLNSPHFDAFSRYISMAEFRDENLLWFESNRQKIEDLQTWIDKTNRYFF